MDVLVKAVVSALKPEEYTVESNSGHYFRWLEAAFPVRGSKIAWSDVPGAIERDLQHLGYEDYCAEALRLLREVVEKEKLKWTDVVVVVVDAPDDHAVRLELASLADALPSILSTWQHTYVLSPSDGWCFVSTMEGSLSFGRAAPNAARPKGSS